VLRNVAASKGEALTYKAHMWLHY